MYNYLIAICNLPCYLTQKVNVEARREGYKVLGLISPTYPWSPTSSLLPPHHTLPDQCYASHPFAPPPQYVLRPSWNSEILCTQSVLHYPCISLTLSPTLHTLLTFCSTWHCLSAHLGLATFCQLPIDFGYGKLAGSCLT